MYFYTNYFNKRRLKIDIMENKHLPGNNIVCSYFTLWIPPVPLPTFQFQVFIHHIMESAAPPPPTPTIVEYVEEYPLSLPIIVVIVSSVALFCEILRILLKRLCLRTILFSLCLQLSQCVSPIPTPPSSPNSNPSTTEPFSYQNQQHPQHFQNQRLLTETSPIWVPHGREENLEEPPPLLNKKYHHLLLLPPPRSSSNHMTIPTPTQKTIVLAGDE